MPAVQHLSSPVTTLAGVAFEVPDYPGAAPDYPPNSTGRQITAIDKEFKRTMDEVLSLGLREQPLRKFLRDNALKVYGLSE